ncbi:MAG: 1-deoxy-D-xylulose-5-phosphate reductoisomerase [Puniceicoccales bacterium]|jgi:1-deoxy-D-xylulose-5-phosphate reductoisomerase|nr:1-deoxy-D-xylulose-5-phosphate reductoisomerase [Puniceicoccales bacterium]
MNLKKRIIILGATGSVGTTVLSEIAAHPDQFQLIGASCYTNIHALKTVVHRFSPQAVAIAHPEIAVDCHFNGIVFRGTSGLAQMVDHFDFDILVVATSGIDSLRATLKAIEKGKDIILANKEILVIAGAMVTQRAQQTGSVLLPLDSEHNAIFQCIQGNQRFIKNLWLTASGGKFWDSNPGDPTVEMVLQHPQWSMGKKITVDSSTMANKGLEVIEAMHLFKVDASQIKVAIHRSCIVHSLVEFCDGSFLAHMSPPSMKYAARHCLFYPERTETQEPSLDLYQIGSLNFERPNEKRFPCLHLAMEVAKGKQSEHIAFNGANEIAVELFLQKKIAFSAIPHLIESILPKIEPKDYATVEEILAVDQMVRSKTKQLAKCFYR